jgi:hypothetical protein
VHGALKKLLDMLSAETKTEAGQTVSVLIKAGTKITVVSDGGPRHFWNQVTENVCFLLLFFRPFPCLPSFSHIFSILSSIFTCFFFPPSPSPALLLRSYFYSFFLLLLFDPTAKYLAQQ